MISQNLWNILGTALIYSTGFCLFLMVVFTKIKIETWENLGAAFVLFGAGIIGVGIKYTIFGTIFGELILFFGDLALLVVSMIILYRIFVKIRGG